MLFDSHAHLNFEAFKDNWKEVLDDCQKNNVWVVNIGSQYSTSKRAIEIAEQYEKGVYAAIGVHPIHAHESENFFDYKKFVDLIKESNSVTQKLSLRGVPHKSIVGDDAAIPRNHRLLLPRLRDRNDKGRAWFAKKVVAIGETGLDFYHSAEYFDIQKKTFIDQIHLAKEFDLPLVIHGRNSKDGKINCYEEIYKIVKKEKVSRAVVHCFGGTSDEAKAFMALGLYIGITGIVTFKNAKDLQTMVRDIIPLEKIMIETDSPYLAPDPYRGKQNKPQYVEFVARKIAEIKDIALDGVSEATSRNAKNFYKI